MAAETEPIKYQFSLQEIPGTGNIPEKAYK